MVNHPFIVKLHFAFKTHEQVPARPSLTRQRYVTPASGLVRDSDPY